MLGTLLVMWLAGIELERISLGALIIAMGMLVDNAVVVCDGMLVRQRQGKSILEASQQTLQQTQWPLLSDHHRHPGLRRHRPVPGHHRRVPLLAVLRHRRIAAAQLVTGPLLVPLFGHYLLRNAGADEDADAAYDGPWYARYRRLAQACCAGRS